MTAWLLSGAKLVCGKALDFSDVSETRTSPIATEKRAADPQWVSLGQGPTAELNNLSFAFPERHIGVCLRADGRIVAVQFD